MRIDLSPLLEGKQTQLETESFFWPEQNDHGVLLPEEIKLREPIHVRCVVTDKSGYMTFLIDRVLEVVDKCPGG